MENVTVSYKKMIKCKPKQLELIPIIRSVDELAGYLHVNEKLLYAISNHPHRWYRIFKIPKRNGSERIIEAPEKLLKRIQLWIQTNVLSCFEVSPYSTAFTPHRNIRNNALFHVNQKIILNCDVRNFFPSLKSALVFDFFRQAGYASDVSMMLTRLCTLYGHLPQGAPTSPLLSNLLLLAVDEALSEWAGLHGLRYSRYADDVTFSGEIDAALQFEIIGKIKQELSTLGLKLNTAKTKRYHHGQRQLVTGLVVNTQVGVAREKIRELRTWFHFLELKIRLDEFYYDSEELEYWLGMVNYYRSINCNNLHLEEWRNRLLEIKSLYR